MAITREWLPRHPDPANGPMRSAVMVLPVLPVLLVSCRSTQVSPRFDSPLVFKRFVHRFGFRFCMIVFAVLLFVGSYAVYTSTQRFAPCSKCIGCASN
jgi:hypothetical protein